MDDNSAFTYKQKGSAGSLLAKLLFSHVGMFFLVAAYASLGAQMFIAIELPNEEDKVLKMVRASGQVDETLSYVVNYLWDLNLEKNATKANYTKEVVDAMRGVESYIIDKVGTYGYGGGPDGWDYAWTFPKSLLLTISIMTTIGYGHISPETFWGMLFCIMYSLVGCPLLLIFLANIGDAMANSFVYIYSRCFCRWCRSRRHWSELPEGASKKEVKLLIDDVVGVEEFMPTSNVSVPIVINLVVLSAFICCGGVLFSSWENWSVSSSCYFTFITLSTVGYGDMYPKKTLLGDVSDLGTMLKIFACVLYILFGMALLSMCINLMQEQLAHKARWMAEQLGLNKDKGKVKEVKDMDVSKKKKNKNKKDNNDDDDTLKDDPLDDTFKKPTSAISRPRSSDVLPGSFDD